jgi:hypothetical protein
MSGDAVPYLVLIPLFFLILHATVIPLLQRLSIRVRGRRFAYRLRPDFREPPEQRRDVMWSAAGVALALVITFVIYDVLVRFGWLPKPGQ